MTQSENGPAPSMDAADIAIRQARFEERMRARNIAGLVILSLATLGLVVFSYELASLITGRYSDSDQLRVNASMIRIFGGMMLIATLGMGTYVFASGQLAGPWHLKGGPSDRGSHWDALATAVAAIEAAASDMKSNRLVTSEDRQAISKELEALVTKVVPEHYFTKIDEKYGGAIRNEKVSLYLEAFLELSKQRMLAFQAGVSRKSASSLAWGLSIATLGLLFLGAFIFGLGLPTNVDTLGAAFHYGARLAFVVLLEVVAFFFLSQYRFALQDEKYVNNEVTNAEMRLLAAIAAAKLNDQVALSGILADLGKTERNFALKKGEVSVFHSGAGGDLIPMILASRLLAGGGELKDTKDKK